MKIADEIHREFPPVNSVEIQIVKLHPPIVNFTGRVAVTYRKLF